jgi:hypothetical protein
MLGFGLCAEPALPIGRHIFGDATTTAGDPLSDWTADPVGLAAPLRTCRTPSRGQGAAPT